MDLVSRQHYQIACQRYFEATHQTELDGGIQHPNQYFQESQRIVAGEIKEKTKGIHKVYFFVSLKKIKFQSDLFLLLLFVLDLILSICIELKQTKYYQDSVTSWN